MLFLLYPPARDWPVGGCGTFGDGGLEAIGVGAWIPPLQLLLKLGLTSVTLCLRVS